MVQRKFRDELPSAFVPKTDSSIIQGAEDERDRYIALLRRYEWLEAMVNHVPDFIYAKDADGRFLFANMAVVENNGFSHVDQLIGLTDADIHPHANAAAQDIDNVERQVMASGAPDLDVEERRMKGQGWLMMSRVPLRDQAGNIIGIVGASRDITARKRAEQLMSAQTKMLRDAARGVELSSFIRTVKALLAGVLVGGKVKIIIGSDRDDLSSDKISFPIVCRDGKICGEMIVDVYLMREAGMQEFLGGVAQTIGIAIDRDRDTHHIAFLAEHDALTGLANRTLLNRKIGAMFCEGALPLAIAFIDLDNFKHVNDGLGHAAGDELLRVISRRILSATGPDATVARIGGDEFIVVLPAMPDDATTCLQGLQTELAVPVQLDGVAVRVTCSIGVAFSSEHGNTAEELFANADMALYRVKENGRNGIRVFSPDIADTARNRLERVEELRRAIDRDEFVLHFQPQKDIASGRINGVEALIRWQHPTDGLLMPGSFIPIAEEAGLITPIGNIVLRKACAQATEWIRNGLPPLRVAVNISARQFLEPSLCNTVSSVLDEFRLDHSMLELEVTESLIMEDLNGAIERMHELKSLGLSLAIDDFGTGYSSLSTLKMFPLDRLKIDRSFFTDIPGDAGDKAIVAAIIAMAKTLGLEAVAEGIEQPEQLTFLVETGCDAFQGYHLAKPLQAADVAIFIRETHDRERPRPEPRVDAA